MLTGVVTRILRGEDGEPGTEYMVDYEGEGESEINHLFEDYHTGDLTFLPHNPPT